MIPNRSVGLSRIHLIIQITVSMGFFWVIYAILHFGPYQDIMADPEGYLINCGILVLAFMLEFQTRSQDEKMVSGLSRAALKGISYRQLVFVMATMFGFLFITKDENSSRLFLGLYFATNFAWFLWSNLFGFRMLNRLFFHNADKGRGRAVLVGSGSEINHYLSNSKAPIFPGLDILGYVTIGSESTGHVAALPELGSFHNIRDICEKSKAKALVLLGLQDRSDLVNPVIQLADDFGLRALWIDNVESRFGGRFHPYHTGKYSIVSHMNEPLEDPINRVAKRAFDLVGAIFGILFVLPPAILAVWLIQRKNAPGPIFYRQKRTGRNGERFEVYKFRSMYVKRNNEGVQTEKNDPRIFPGGNFIRKTSIDELPQLINVLKGDMSIVGPRPHAEFTDVEHANKTHLYRLRSLAKPGITGLAQCKGFRGDTSEPSQIRNRVRMDLFYIQKWTFGLDVLIVTKTVLQLVKPPKSAY